jgi:hypothetical protein
LEKDVDHDEFNRQYLNIKDHVFIRKLHASILAAGLLGNLRTHQKLYSVFFLVCYFVLLITFIKSILYKFTTI